MGVRSSKQEGKVFIEGKCSAMTSFRASLSSSLQSVDSMPAGGLKAQGRGMSMSRLNLQNDPADSEDEDAVPDMNPRLAPTLFSTPISPLVFAATEKKTESTETKSKEVAYWYFDIGASMKRRSWRIMEIGNAGIIFADQCFQ
jgi:hypothetical protein